MNSCAGGSVVLVANRVLLIVLALLAIISIPLSLLSTFILGLIVRCTLGLFIFVLNGVWLLFLVPLLFLSWVSGRWSPLRNTIGFAFMPWAILTCEVASMMPHMGEVHNRAFHFLLCETWPFSWEFWLFSTGKLRLESADSGELDEVLERAAGNDQLKWRTVSRLIDGAPLD